MQASLGRTCFSLSSCERSSHVASGPERACRQNNPARPLLSGAGRPIHYATKRTVALRTNRVPDVSAEYQDQDGQGLTEPRLL